MATDVDNKDDEGDDASLTGCDEGDNRNRDDGKDACASATATTQPDVRRRCVERRRRCEEMQHDNQLARTKRRGQGWTRAAAARRKVTRGGGTYGEVDDDGDGATPLSNKKCFKKNKILIVLDRSTLTHFILTRIFNIFA